MSLNLFIIGPSGCGKSTQARMLAQKYNLSHLSMGQLFREEIASGSEIGNLAKSYIDQGKWVPDEVTVDLLKVHLDKIEAKNFIVDGFPRTLTQGPLLEDYLRSKNENITFFIHLDVTAEEIIKRRSAQALAGTRFSDANRSDENPEAIRERQKQYDLTIKPILDYFEENGRLKRIDGNRPVEPIFDDICLLIDKINIEVKS